jgi:hypothetical protein
MAEMAEICRCDGVMARIDAFLVWLSLDDGSRSGGGGCCL